MTTRLDHSVRPDALLTAGGPATAPAEPPHSAFCGNTTLDDSTVAYVLAAQPCFERLKQAIGQVGGLLVLAAAGSKSITQEHAMLESARLAHAEASANLADLRVPAPAAHHHHHLTEAAAAIAISLAQAAETLHAIASGRCDVAQAHRPLKHGHQHLNWAAHALPGFAMVSFDQACCAGHAADCAPSRK